MGFDADTRLRPTGDGAYEAEISEAWWTPRGPLGGYVMAIVLRALELAVDDAGRRPLSLTVSFMLPPAPGPATVRARIERAGRSLTTASGRLEQDGEPMALALASFSVPWEGPLLDEAPMPEVEPPEWRRPPQFELPDGAPPFIAQLSGPTARRQAVGWACARSASSTRPRSRCWPTPGSPHRGRGCASWRRRPRSR
jgi:acyl-CoA thioesterase